MCAVGFGQLAKIRVDHVGADHPPGIVAFLVHANRRVDTVVDHDDDDIGFVLHRGCEFLTVHHKVAIAGECHHGAVGMYEFGRNRSGYAIAHRAAGRSELGAILTKAIKTVQPSGVIPSAIANNRIVSGFLFDCFDDIGKLHRAFYVDRAIPGFEFLSRLGQLRLPVATVFCRDFVGQQGFYENSGRSIDREIGLINMPQFFSPCVYMNQGLTRVWDIDQAKTTGGHFAEPSAYDQQQVATSDSLG